MDQRSICLFLNRQRLSALDIHGQLVAVLGSDAIANSSVTKYLRGKRCTVVEEVMPELESPEFLMKQFWQRSMNTHSRLWETQRRERAFRRPPFDDG
jgi:hypothetical protein